MGDTVGGLMAAGSSGGLRGPRACRVPFCPIDVSTQKTYNSRYRICEEHRAASSIVIDGRRQRFCQMCAKFHDVNEFEGERHSCLCGITSMPIKTVDTFPSLCRDKDELPCEAG